MQHTLTKGRYRARLTQSPGDVCAAQELRHRVFLSCSGERQSTGLDADAYDTRCQHILIEDIARNQLVCCFRVLPLSKGQSINSSYSAQYYELSALQSYRGGMIELGRFCVDPDVKDPDILRLAWAALTAVVEEQGAQFLFGCASFKGTDAQDYMDAFAMLKARHLAPRRWLPKVKAPNVFRFGRVLRRNPDTKRAMQTMPPLLRSYLSLGGWVSDHAVVDDRLNTLHVFTGLEIGTIPAARKRLLRLSAL